MKKAAICILLPVFSMYGMKFKINIKKYATIKNIPFANRIKSNNGLKGKQVSFAQKNRFSTKTFDYSLSGLQVMAEKLKLTNQQLVHILHDQNLTVAHAVEEDCRKEILAIYEDIKEWDILDDNDLQVLSNILKLRSKALNGHYQEANITFSNDIDPIVVQMTKEAFKRANIPFTVEIDIDRSGRTEAAAKYGFDTPSATVEGFFSDTSKLDRVHELIADTFDIENFAINNDFKFKMTIFPVFSNFTVDQQKCIIAHETIHILNMHQLQDKILESYLNKIKKWSVTEEDKNTLIGEFFRLISKSYERQADLLPLIHSDYAQAAEKIYRDEFGSRSFIYLPARKLYNYSRVANNLHIAEHNILCQSDHSFYIPSIFD